MAMNWAWQQRLPPTPKLILMALADAANDAGVCWPSIPTVASKCCVSIRTVRRVMKMLGERRLMLSEPRYRKDGSTGTGCNWKGVTDCHRPLTLVTPPPVSGARVPLTPVTYQEPP